MTDSLRLLLERSLDYAGLFPPASLSMDQAVPLFLAETSVPTGGMLSRFVCPATKLPELAGVLPATGGTAAPLTVSVLGRTSKTAGEFLANLDTDLSAITAFRARVADRVKIDVVELRIPTDGHGTSALKKLLVTIEALLARVPDNGLQPYFEFSAAPALPEHLAVIADHNAATPARHKRPAGFKLRTGGTDAAMFPSSAQVAGALAAARQAGLALKCTGGLHNALSQPNGTLPVRMHGFINLLIAGALAHATGAEPAVLEAVLAEEKADSFSFSDGNVGWRDLLLSVPQIAAARRDFLVAFGCCYLDQPRTGLHAAGWA